jgi:hypothetical protein
MPLHPSAKETDVSRERDRRFESVFLQWRVGEPSVPQRGPVFEEAPAHRNGGVRDSLKEAFSFDRCMWGTDWTRAVKLLTYKEGVEAFRVTDRLSDGDRAKLMGGTASRIYGLSPAKARPGLTACTAR